MTFYLSPGVCATDGCFGCDGCDKNGFRRAEHEKNRQHREHWRREWHMTIPKLVTLKEFE